MKNSIVALVIFFFLGCDDGDLEIVEIDFDGIALEACAEDVEATLFFKRNNDEALILVLEAGILENIADHEVSSTIPGQSEFYYRFFDGNVTTNYFCDNEIPPATPVVTKEVTATGGTVIITTVEEDLGAGEFNYHHTFTIENLILTNPNGEQIIDTNFELGTFTINVTP